MSHVLLEFSVSYLKLFAKSDVGDYLPTSELRPAPRPLSSTTLRIVGCRHYFRSLRLLTSGSHTYNLRLRRISKPFCSIMASKRAIQIPHLRCIALTSRHVSRLGQQAIREYSMFAQSPAATVRVSNKHVKALPDFFDQQKRWNSRAAEARGTKIYEFDDVLFSLYFPRVILHDIDHV